MSDRAALLIEQLADGPQTTDDLVEATGLERSAVSQELAGLKHAGTVHSGRGGWHLADRPPAKVKRHEAAAKMLRFSVSDTARLKGLMARWGSMIGDEEAA